MNVVEIHNQVPVLLIFARFSFNPFAVSCITKIQCVAKGEGLFYPIFGLVALFGVDIECTLTLDCVGCVLLRKSPAFHPFECHLFTPFLIALLIFSHSAHTVAPMLGQTNV